MSETAEQKKIYTVLPDEIRNGHPHGQWVTNTPGLVINFACDIDEEGNRAIIEPWAKKLADFLAGDEPYLEFESPHTPGINYLMRAAAEHIVLTAAAWSAKVLARTRPDGRGPQIVDDSGLPVIRKLRDS